MTEPIAPPEDQADRCGHNYASDQCPYIKCGYRESLERIAELESRLRVMVCVCCGRSMVNAAGDVQEATP